METAKKETRGGARTGAGRPRKEPTRVLGVRVPDSRYDECREVVKIHLKDADDIRQLITKEALLDLGFKYNPHPQGDAKAWFRYELDNCILYVQLNGRVSIDDNMGDGEITLLTDANINQVRILLIALSR